MGASARKPSRWYHWYDTIGPRDVISDVTSPIDSSWPLSCRLPVVKNPLSPAVSEIFSVKMDTDTTTYQMTPRYTPQPYSWGMNGLEISELKSVQRHAPASGCLVKIQFYATLTQWLTEGAKSAKWASGTTASSATLYVNNYFYSCKLQHATLLQLQ